MKKKLKGEIQGDRGVAGKLEGPSLCLFWLVSDAKKYLLVKLVP